MPAFLIRQEGKSERRLTLDAPIIKIGRGEKTHLHLDDVGVSRMHAVIEVDKDGAMTLIDLGTAEGTFVNDARIAKSVVRAGDRIRVGSTTIFVEGQAARRNDEPLLPSPEIVRERLGAEFAPQEIFGVAALVLQVDGVRREAWSDETELAEPLFASYPRGAVPPPEIATIARSHKTIDDARETRVQRCSSCVIRPGFAPCTICLGSGAGSNAELNDRCTGCNGEGFLPCTICDGTMRVVSCSIRYVNDAPVRVRRVIMPAVPTSIRSFVEARIHADAPWPAAHAFDPEPSMVASAYRGASTMRATEEFHGFFFGDAIAHGLVARDDATSGLARFETRTFAIPILWTVSHDRNDAFFYDAAGVFQHVSGA